MSTSSYTKSSTPPVCVGPAITELTVTPVPAASLAKPRDTASSAVFDMPYWIISAGITIAESLAMFSTRPHPLPVMPGR